MKINELKKLITTELKKYCSLVYYERAETNAVYPYITYEITNLNVDIDPLELIQFEVDIWDNKKPFTIDEITEKILDKKTGLNFTTIDNEDMNIRFFASNMNLGLKDKTIRRNRLIVDCRIYFK